MLSQSQVVPSKQLESGVHEAAGFKHHNPTLAA